MINYAHTQLKMGYEGISFGAEVPPLLERHIGGTVP